MSDVKNILIKVLYFIISLILIGFIYNFLFYETDLEKHSGIIFNLRNVEEKSQILYFGESSNFTSRSDDKEKKRISAFAAEYFPKLNFNVVDNSAYHAGNFKVLLQNISASSPVQTVVITMNLRSFGADWIYSDLETALQKSMVLLNPHFPPLVNRIRLSFKDYEIKSKEERIKQKLHAWENDKIIFPFPFSYHTVTTWDKAVANGSWLNKDDSWDMPKIDLSCYYVKTYAFQINPASNPRIKDFDDIVEIARKRGWNLVFNLMAENVEKAQELVGDELVWLIRQNRDLLITRYQNKGAIVVDNLECVPDSEYIDRNWTTEHYAEKGRRIIAKNLADSLRKFYPEDYHLPSFPVNDSLNAIKQSSPPGK
jgi:hypothetical protein